MVYLLQSDIESSGGGYGYADFKQAGTAMTATQWQLYSIRLIDSITSAINHYCRVTSFEENTYTEYHDGRGASAELGEYMTRDRTFLLREQPATSITSVSENLASTINPIAWTARTPRTTTSAVGAADYELLARGTLSYIYFHQNVPAKGQNNVKIVYVAGWDSDSERLDDIRLIAMQIADNFLARRKRYQEANAARTNGTQDSADMFKLDNNGDVFTPDIKMQLDKYRRYRTGGVAWR
jgi:hypothetical protein